MGRTDYAALKRASHRLRQIADRAENTAGVWPSVSLYLSKTAARQFATKGKRLGTPWKPLAESTVREKVRLGFPKAALIRTRALRGQFTDRPRMHDEHHGPRSAFFGSATDLAKWQARGTRRKGAQHIPPRPILIATEREKREIAGMVRRYIAGGRKAIHYKGRRRAT